MKSRSTLDPDLFASYCWTKSSHIFSFGNHRTPNVKKGETLKESYLSCLSHWFLGEIFFLVVNAKKLKFLTDKILLDRFWFF